MDTDIFKRGEINKVTSYGRQEGLFLTYNMQKERDYYYLETSVSLDIIQRTSGDM